ncbi:MAG: Cof-type HAD-IIB family hydrolase [Bacillota bacterium]
MIKLIALDLDGTLNNSAKIITPKTRAALLAIQDRGVLLVLASGRPLPGLFREADSLGIAGFGGSLISYNGGKVIDYANKRVIYENSIPAATAHALLRHLGNYPVLPIVDDGQYIYTDQPQGFQMQQESRMNQLPIRTVDNVLAAVNFDPVKVLIAAPPEILAPHIAAISQPFTAELSFIQSAPFYLEATALGVNKGAALQMLCAELGIAREAVMAFGDAQNDLSMLQFAGIGVAMDNACATLKAVADEITLSNDDDGIAHTLGKYFPGLLP